MSLFRVLDKLLMNRWLLPRVMMYLSLLAALYSNPAQSVEWAKNFNGPTGTGVVQVRKTAVDNVGNTYLVGIATNSPQLTFGSVTLNSIGSQDVFVVKKDAAGNVVWAKNFGGSGAYAYGLDIAVDGMGNVYLGGYFGNASLTTPALAKIGGEDAFAFKLDSGGNITWAKNFGGSGAYAWGRGIAVDGSGNVYLGGTFTANLTTPALTKIGGSDAFALKLDASGNTTWAKNFGGSGANTYSNSIAVDGTGNVYLGGEFSGANLTTPALTKIGVSDAFALKLDASGNSTWAKNIGGSGGSTTGQSIAVDGTGNVYLGGGFGANLTTPVLTKIGNLDAYALKLNASGITTWVKNFGGSGAYAHGYDIEVDGSGNVYLGGHFWNANLTAPALARIGDQDVFAFKLDASGNTTWAKNFGGSGAVALGNGIAVDSSGSVYLGGSFMNNLTTPTLTSIGNQDGFSLKLDSSGTTTWAKSYGGTTYANSNAYGIDSAVDSAGNVYLVGNFNSSLLTLGSVTLTRIGSQDAFAAKMDATGNVLWAKNFGGSGARVVPKKLAVDGSGQVYITGFFQSANLTTPVLTKIGGTDAFAFKLDASGNTTWAKNFGGSGANTYSNSIAVDGTGNVYLGGHFWNANLTTPALTKIGGTDAFAFKLDASGNTTWAKNFGGSGASAVGYGIAVDGGGNVYLGGYLINNLTAPVLTKIGSTDAFAFKLDASGNTTWAKNFGGSGANAYGKGIAVDGSGNVYLGGDSQGNNLTTPALTKIGDCDVFALQLDTSGNTAWAKNIGGSGACVEVNDIDIDAGGNVYMTGAMNANLTSPALPLIAGRDILALKLDASGNNVWARNYGGSDAVGRGIAVDGDSNIYVAGEFGYGNLIVPPLTRIGGVYDALILKDATLTSQTITFAPLGNKMYGDADFVVSASASSGLTVSFTSQTVSVCTVSGATVTLVAAGACTIRASQTGNGAYNAAPDVDQSFNVGAKALTITGLSAQDKPYDGNTTATLTGSATLSGVVSPDGNNEIALTGTASGAFDTPNVGSGKPVTVSGLSLTGSKASSYSLTPLTLSANITQAPQTITFTPPASGVTGEAVALSASGGASGNPVTFSAQSGPCTLASPNLTLTGVGSCVVRASQAGNANYSAAPDVERTITVNPADTTATITGHTPDPSSVGQGISVSYTVTATSPGAGTPTGSVTVSDGTDSCSASVAAGTCTLTPTTGGAKTLTATYAGDTNYNGSTSSGVSHTVNAMATTTAVTVVNPSGQSNATNSASSVYGQPVTVSVTVTASNGTDYPPGTVDVSVGGKTCQVALSDQTGGISGGQCAIDASSGFPDVGASQLVAASYTPGSSNFAASSSSGAGNGSLTVTEADTTTALTTNPVNSTAGGSVDLVATISATSPSLATPAGTVAFTADTFPVAGCGAVAVGNDGKATCTTGFATWGNKTIHAAFTGNANFNDSDSGNETHTVNSAASTTVIDILNPASGPYTYGDGIEVTVSVSGSIGLPTGEVTVSAGAASCPATLASGEGSCTLYPPAGSPTTLSATYNGDTVYGGSSANTTVTVNKATPTVTLTPTPSPSTVGDGVTFNVTVARPNANSLHPTGTVAVKNGAATLCTTGSLVNGSASCAQSFAATGSYSLTAEYVGDTNYQSYTGTASHEVQVASTSTTINTMSPNPATYGQAVTVSVTVTGNATLGAPTGTVDITGAGTCTATLTPGVGTQSTGSCQPTGLIAGVGQTVTATYSGDAVYGGSTDNDSLTVNPASAAATLGDLGPYTYDGTQKSATCTTTPSVSYDISYQSGAGRTEVGSYGVTCTVTDPNYTGSDSGSLTIGQASPSITWGNPTDIVYGTALSGTQLNASANVAGGFVYNPVSGTVLNVGSHTLNTTFTPDDAVNYTGATDSVSLNVTQAGQAIVFTPPASGVVGQVIALSATGGASGNAVILAVQSGPCSLTGNNLSLTGLGSCTVSANQAGNTNYAAPSTATAGINVNKADTTTSITGHSPNLSVTAEGIAVTYTVTVNAPGAGTPTGNVTVSDGAASCTATVAAGGCTLTPSTAGAKTLTATYAGDASFNGSISAGASHTVNVTKTYTAPSPSGGGNITASFTGGGAGCTYSQARFITAMPPTPPAGVNFPHGLFDFSLGGCAVGGTVSFTITYPTALPTGTQYWKYGPTPGDATPHWYTLTVADNNLSISGNVVTFSITDGQLGDDDRTPNGEIIDQGGPGNGNQTGAGKPIPTLSQWGVILLSMLIFLTLAWLRQGQARRNKQSGI